MQGKKIILLFYCFYFLVTLWKLKLFMETNIRMNLKHRTMLLENVTFSEFYSDQKKKNFLLFAFFVQIITIVIIIIMLGDDAEMLFEMHLLLKHIFKSNNNLWSITILQKIKEKFYNLKLNSWKCMPVYVIFKIFVYLSWNLYLFSAMDLHIFDRGVIL